MLSLAVLMGSTLPSAPPGGTASWYDDGSGLYAAVPSYRFGDPTYPLNVCAGTRCVQVTVRDHCQCHVGTSRERIIDLSRDAFSRLAPLSRGLVRVTLSEPVPNHLPATDTEGT